MNFLKLLDLKTIFFLLVATGLIFISLSQSSEIKTLKDEKFLDSLIKLHSFFFQTGHSTHQVLFETLQVLKI